MTVCACTRVSSLVSSCLYWWGAQVFSSQLIKTERQFFFPLSLSNCCQRASVFFWGGGVRGEVGLSPAASVRSSTGTKLSAHVRRWHLSTRSRLRRRRACPSGCARVLPPLPALPASLSARVRSLLLEPMRIHEGHAHPAVSNDVHTPTTQHTDAPPPKKLLLLFIIFFFLEKKNEEQSTVELVRCMRPPVLRHVSFKPDYFDHFTSVNTNHNRDIWSFIFWFKTHVILNQ